MYDEILPGIFVKVEVNTKYRVCERKYTYKNQTEATESAERSSTITGEQITAYRCRVCSCWHIGHKFQNSW
jgi:hypothetical protein